MAQNGIIGDSAGIDLPQAVVDNNQFQEEKMMAAFSRTDEFKRLKQHLEERIKFYETYLPSGSPAGTTELSNEKLGENWKVANQVITEFRAVISAYEIANEVLSGK